MSIILISAALGCLAGIAGGYIGMVIGAYFSPMIRLFDNRFQCAWSFGNDGIRLGAIGGVICGVGTAATINLSTPAIVIASAGLLFGGCAWLLVRGMYERPVGFVSSALGGGLGGAYGGYLSLLFF